MGRLDHVTSRVAHRVASVKPRGAGVAASILLLAGSAAYGTLKGEHLPVVLDMLKHARDAGANAAGFRITEISIAGRRKLAEGEVLAAAGVTPDSSLLFLDVDDARRGLEAMPWIAQATVRKLYPGHLRIEIEEREPFAIWQKNGALSVVAVDGTVLGPLGERPVSGLPQVVGYGAAAKARDFLSLVDRYPVIREQLRASILVADRRWNLKLKSGLDIRLPETGVEAALDRLVTLDRDKKLLSRDLTAIDLRLADRVSVRLSDEAGQAREQAAKDKAKKKKKGGDA